MLLIFLLTHVYNQTFSGHDIKEVDDQNEPYKLNPLMVVSQNTVRKIFFCALMFLCILLLFSLAHFIFLPLSFSFLLFIRSDVPSSISTFLAFPYFLSPLSLSFTLLLLFTPLSPISLPIFLSFPFSHSVSLSFALPLLQLSPFLTPSKALSHIKNSHRCNNNSN